MRVFWTIGLVALLSCGGADSPGPAGAAQPPAAAAPPAVFGNPERVTVQGYDQDLMEPFVSRDGRYLFFNNRNDPGTDTDLFYAERLDDLTFAFRGPIAGANSPALDAVASMDMAGNFYFVTTRSYPQDQETLYSGRFQDGTLIGVAPVRGLSLHQIGSVNFDAEINREGTALYSVDGVFQPGSPGPRSATLILAAPGGPGFLRQDPAILAPVNGPDPQYAPATSGDGLELYFTRLVPGQVPAMFRAWRAGTAEPFGAPERLWAADGFVEAPALSPDERSLYYHKLEGGRFVLYRLTR
ncbi:MAG: hypothetical protein AB1758_17270 [Candidatus Eremiobacterota bacterium]